MPWNNSRNAGVDIAVAPLPHGGNEIDEVVGELRVHGLGGVGGQCSARSAVPLASAGRPGLREPAGWELGEKLLDEGGVQRGTEGRLVLSAIGGHGNEREEFVLRRFEAALTESGLDNAVALLLGDLEDERGLDNAVALLLGDLGYGRGLRYRPGPRERAIDVVAGLWSRREPWERAIGVDEILTLESTTRAPATSSTNGQDVARHDGESFGCGCRHFWHA